MGETRRRNGGYKLKWEEAWLTRSGEKVRRTLKEPACKSHAYCLMSLDLMSVRFAKMVRECGVAFVCGPAGENRREGRV